MRFVKLRKNKRQCFLLGLIFTIVISLFSVCTIFCVKANTFVKEYYKGDTSPDIAYTTVSESAAKKSVEWARLQGNNLRNLSKKDIFSVSNNIRVNDNLLDAPASFIIPIKDINDLQWKVKISNGDLESSAPRSGEIWILKSYANKKGITIGDKIKVKDSEGKYIEFKVSSLINDSNQASITQTILYFYINNEDIDGLKNVEKAYFITFNTNEPYTKEAYKKVTDDMSKYINEPVNGFIQNKQEYISQASAIPLQIGGIGMVSGMLLIIILIIILRSNLWNFILKEYKSIGIYKSIGMNSKQIGRFYLEYYGAISVVSSLIGLIASIPISEYMCNTIFQYIGKYSFDSSSFVIVMSIFIGFNLLVYLNLKYILRKVKEIKPVEAINIGLTSSKEKFKKSLIKNTSNSFAMAINDIFKYKKSSIITVLTFTLCFYICLFFINIENSMFKMDKNFSEWFNIPKSDMVISTSGSSSDSLKEVTKYMEEKGYTKKAYLWDMYDSNKNIRFDDVKYKGDVSPFNIVIYNEYNEEDFSINRGRNPREKNEIAVTESLMKKNSLKIGDYMEFIVKGERKEYLIIGTYNIIDDDSVRILTESVEGKGGNNAFIKLNHKEDYEKIKKELKDKFDYITVDKVFTAMGDAVVNIKELSLRITTIILGGIMAFAIMVVISLVMSINSDNRKNYGVMKAQGFSSSYIRNRCLYRITILSFIGAVIGLGINLISSREVLRAMLKGVNGYVFTLFGTWAAILGLMAVIIISTILSCRSIKKISTVELIVD